MAISNFNLSGAIRLGPMAAAPSVAVAGVMYFNTTDSKLYVHDGASWQEVATGSADLSAYLKADGTTPITGQLVPNADGTLELGASDKLFRRIWSDRIAGLTRVQGNFSDSGPTSDLSVRTNAADMDDGESGSLFLETGSSDLNDGEDIGEGSGATGNISIRTGATQGDRGQISLDAASINLIGDTFASTGSRLYFRNASDDADLRAISVVGDGLQFGSSAGVDTLAIRSNNDITVASTDGDIILSPRIGKSVIVSGQKITSLGTPTADSDAATKKYVDDAVSGIPAPDLSDYVKKDGSVAWTGDMSAGSNKLTNLDEPSASTDAATKNYVDTQIAAIPDPMVYMGTWDADQNDPTLADGTGTNGQVYQVTVAGTQDLGSGDIDFEIGDKVVYNGSVWEKWDMTDAVSSVNGQTGAVSLALSNLTNVDASAPDDGQVLTWSASSSKWEATTPGAGYTDQEAQDAVGGILDDGTIGDIEFAYDSGTPSISANIKDGSVITDKIADDAVTADKIESTLVLKGGTYRGATSSASTAVYEVYQHQMSLLSSQTAADIADLAFTHAQFDGCEITYKLKDSATNVRIGTLRIVTNGTVVTVNDTFTETAPTNFSFDVSIVSTEVRISYASGAQTATLRADSKLFRS